MFHIIGWMIFGLIVGAIAKLLMPGPDPKGCFVTMFLGIAGAFVGGFIGRALGGSEDMRGILSYVLAIIGAMILLLIFRWATANKRPND